MLFFSLSEHQNKTAFLQKLETPLIDGDLAWRQHAGGHTPAPNWTTFIEFASRYF